MLGVHQRFAARETENAVWFLLVFGSTKKHGLNKFDTNLMVPGL